MTEHRSSLPPHLNAEMLPKHTEGASELPAALSARPLLHTKAATIRFICIFCLLLFTGGLAPSLHAQSNTIYGIVRDAETNAPIPAAEVQLKQQDHVVRNTRTDKDGHFGFHDLRAVSYMVFFKAEGYLPDSAKVHLAAGGRGTVSPTLARPTVDPSVSAASKQLPMDAEVLEVEDFEPGIPNTASALEKVRGFDVAQPFMFMPEIGLRGFNKAMLGHPAIFVDGRPAMLPSLRTNLLAAVPFSWMNVKSVQFVRIGATPYFGPSAYMGAINIVTTSAFDKPGMTLSVMRGSQDSFESLLRHAQPLTPSISYEATARFAKGENDELDPANEEDAKLINYFFNESPPEYTAYTWNFNNKVNVQLNGEGGLLTVNQGIAWVNGLAHSPIGPWWADGLHNSYEQLVLALSGLRLQGYRKKNHTRDSYFFRSGRRLNDRSSIMGADAQYMFTVPQWSTNLILGIDHLRTTSKTIPSRLGWYEQEDLYEIGIYAQGFVTISKTLWLDVAMRWDGNNMMDEIRPSPRVSVMFEPRLEHTVRVTFTRAFPALNTISPFFDFSASNDQTPFAAQQVIVDDQQARIAEVPHSLDGSTAVQDAQMDAPRSGSEAAFQARHAQPTVLAKLATSPPPALLQPTEQHGELVSPVAWPWATQRTGSLTKTDGLLDNDLIKSTFIETLDVGYTGLFLDLFVVSMETYVTHFQNMQGFSPFTIEAYRDFYLLGLDLDVRIQPKSAWELQGMVSFLNDGLLNAASDHDATPPLPSAPKFKFRGAASYTHGHVFSSHVSMGYVQPYTGYAGAFTSEVGGRLSIDAMFKLGPKVLPGVEFMFGCKNLLDNRQHGYAGGFSQGRVWSAGLNILLTLKR